MGIGDPKRRQIEDVEMTHTKRLEDDIEQQWSLVGIYGFIEEHNKRKIWELIKEIIREVSECWLCVVDINDITQASDKFGSIARSNTQFSWSRQAIDSSDLQDLGFVEYPFTWTNGRQGKRNIQYHAALRVEIVRSAEMFDDRRKFIFHFEEVWSKDTRCKELVRKNWSGVSIGFNQKIKALKSLQLEFKEYRTSYIARDVKRVEEFLKHDDCCPAKEEKLKKYKALERQMCSFLRMEEII
ncbi:unnamed protein product [Vicia faba]|uniref:Uncharacterized protein n=1 Tax=Vicia faba TaxID=3906 RepID=A0AAV0ZU76_VICFA|nr:unnamed protein product [Vicia faba]